MDLKEYRTHLSDTFQTRIIKIEWVKVINGQYYVYDSIETDIISGSLTSELKNGIRRNVSLTLNNRDGIYVPHEDGHIWLDKFFYLYTGLELENGERFWNKQGLFTLNNPIVSHNCNGSKLVTITANDLSDILTESMGGTLEYDYIIPQGTNLSNAIRQVYVEAGISSNVHIDRELDNVQSPCTFIIKANQTYESILSKIANLYVYEFFIDVNGIPQFKRRTNETLASSEQLIGIDVEDKTYIGSENSFSTESVKNVVKVIGNANMTETIEYTAENTDILSSTCIQKIGRRVIIIDDSNITTVDLAKQRAEYELKKMSQIAESINITTLINDTLYVGDVITLQDKINGFDSKRVLITSLNITFGEGSGMSIQSTAVRQLQDIVRVES